MAANDRAPYMEQIEAEYTAHILNEQSTFYSLCSFCRYFQFYPGGYDTDADADCEHPLNQMKKLPNGKWWYGVVPFEQASEGGDCWAFRPEWGATCNINRDTWPDSQRRSYKAHQAPGPRIAELIALGADGQEQLREEHYEQWRREHPEYAR